MSEPNSPSSSVTKLSKANFSVEEKVFLREIIKFGIPGIEIRDGKRQPLVPPDPFSFAATFPSKSAASKPSATESLSDSPPRTSSSGPVSLTLSPLEMIHYDAAHQEYTANKIKQIEQRDALLAHILDRLDSVALTALENHPEFSATVSSKDTFRIWQLVRHTNLLDSSANTRHHHLVQFTTLKQTGTFGSYVTSFNRNVGLVSTGFESKQYPGYIKIDDLSKSMFFHGLSSFYSARVEKLLEEKPNINLADSIFDIQQFTTRNEHLIPATSDAYVGKALAAPLVPELTAASSCNFTPHCFISGRSL